jgi:hypothetical protein
MTPLLSARVPSSRRAGDLVVAVAAGVVLCAADGRAQIVTGTLPPPRPILTNPMIQTYPALIASRAHGLNVSASAFSAYDRNNLPTVLTPTAGNSNVPVYRQSGVRAGGSVSLDYRYSHQGQGGTAFSGSARGSVQSYSGTGQPIFTGTAGIHTSVPVGQTSRLRLTGMTRYTPFYNFGLFPGLAGAVDANDLAASIDPDLALAVAPLRSFQHSLNAGISRQLSLRTTVNVDYTTDYTDFLGAPNDNFDHYGGVYVNYRLTQGLSTRVGYRYGYITHSSGPGQSLHMLDGGVNYGQRFALASRNTSLSFGTGSTVVSQPPVGSSRLIGGRVHVDGYANLDHQIKQTWSAQLTYRRGVQFAQGFSGVFFNDTVTAGVGGTLSQRVSTGLSASYVLGAAGVTAVSRHNAVHVNGSVRMTWTSWASGFGQYSYYHYRLGNTVVLPSGFPSQLGRHSVRGGVSLGFRLIG